MFDSHTRRLTPNTLPASTVLLAALPPRHLSLLLLDQVVSGAQLTPERLSSHWFPDGVPCHEGPGLTDRKETATPESLVAHFIHELSFGA